MAGREELTKIGAKLRAGEDVEPVTVRELLSWFDAQRRGGFIVARIKLRLKESGLVTVPDFEYAYIDSPVEFSLVDEVQRDSDQTGPDDTEVGSSASSAIYADPTHRISKLAAANRIPTSISPDATVQQAITVMMTNDFSQLPVMTSERDVKGVISWTSIGTRLALGKQGKHARELMDPHQEIHASSSLFQAIPLIVQHQYVLIRGSDNKITGIVTASDLSRQFQQLAEPFLLLGEIENHIRRILADRLSRDDFASVQDPEDSERNIDGVADLTLGEYIRLLENPERWAKLNLQIDRVGFCQELDRVRTIRNDVMHFDPDPIATEDLKHLRDFAGFLHRLHAIGVPS